MSMSTTRCWLISQSTLAILTGGKNVETRVPDGWFQWIDGGHIQRITVTAKITTETVTDWLFKAEEEDLIPIVAIGPNEIFPDIGPDNPDGETWDDSLEVIYFDPDTDPDTFDALLQSLKHPDPHFIVGWSGFTHEVNRSVIFPAGESDSIADAYANALSDWIKNCKDKDLGPRIGFEPDQWYGRQFERADFVDASTVKNGQPFFGLKNFPFFGLQRSDDGQWVSKGPLPADISLIDKSGDVRRAFDAELEQSVLSS